jgi:invasion protein IalB
MPSIPGSSKALCAARQLLLALLLGVAFGSATAVADNSLPESTTVAYGDWVVRCELDETGNGSKLCEVAHAVPAPNGFAQLAFGAATDDEPLRMAVLLPRGVWLPTGAKLSFGETKDESLTARFKHCREVCFAEVEVDADTLAHLLQQPPAQLTFEDTARREYRLTVSLRGFRRALADIRQQ